MKLFHIVLDDTDGNDHSGFAVAETPQQALDIHKAHFDIEPEAHDSKARVFELPALGSIATAICWDSMPCTELDL